MIDQIYYNNTLQNWLISGGIILFALIINWMITIFNKRYLRAIAKRTKNQLDNIIVNSLETPLKVGIVLIAIWTAFSRPGLTSIRILTRQPITKNVRMPRLLLLP